MGSQMAGVTLRYGASYGLLDPLNRLSRQKYLEWLFKCSQNHFWSIKFFRKSVIFGGQKVLFWGDFSKFSKKCKNPQKGPFCTFFAKFWIFQKNIFRCKNVIFSIFLKFFKKVQKNKKYGFFTFFSNFLDFSKIFFSSKNSFFFYF